MSEQGPIYGHRRADGSYVEDGGPTAEDFELVERMVAGSKDVWPIAGSDPRHDALRRRVRHANGSRRPFDPRQPRPARGV